MSKFRAWLLTKLAGDYIVIINAHIGENGAMVYVPSGKKMLCVNTYINNTNAGGYAVKTGK